MIKRIKEYIYIIIINWIFKNKEDEL